ncbi:MAG: TolC family protein [Muribaculaceae bacterium]|nr:TolC family protein [Muribaculaceae bacterium]
MRRFGITLLASIAAVIGCHAQLTLDYCRSKATENYPLIKKYKLVENTTVLSLSDINRGWLPRIGVFAQGTVQNTVSAFPEVLGNILHQNGMDVAGMSKFQYKAGVELSQTIWDGGLSKANRSVERATADVTQAGIDVDMYAINERVDNIYFGILLLDDQIARVESTISLLESNLARVKVMVENGTALPSDADMIEANIIEMRRQLTEANTTRKAYRSVLAIYINEEVGNQTLEKPQTEMPAEMISARPELSLFDRQINLYDARRSAVKASLMPRFGFFAQAYYGYPGLNIFKGIMERNATFNAVAGVNVSWKIDSFYTRKNANSKLDIAADMTRNDRDVFLYNTKIATEQEVAAIDGIKAVMADDSRLIELRKSVREAAEAQLANGIIDMTALLSKINDENQAELTASYHQVQLLQNIYKLKHTLNR